MRTRLYLVPHGTTEADLVDPPRLPGRKLDPALARLGIRQAELTRGFLAVRPIDHCYCSPLQRAVQTAHIIVGPHDITPVAVDDLIEWDAGSWEGLDWDAIRRDDPENYQRFLTEPEKFRFPGGESPAEVRRRACRVLQELLERHAGEAILIASHQAVLRLYLAELLGLGIAGALQVKLAPCGISIVEQDGNDFAVVTLNSVFHRTGKVE